jgi:hypothetical protein
MDAPRAALEEAKRRIVQDRRAALEERLRRENPDLADTRIRAMVERTPIVVHSEEVPRRLPLKPILALLFGFGGLAALRRGESRPAGVRLSPGSVALTAALAAASMALLLGSGGWIYRSPGLLH